MTHPPTHPPRIHRPTQQGAALIVVLLMLVLIMIVGVAAVRRSNTNLKLATSDQMNTLLLQGADGANLKLEQMVNGSPDSQAYLDITANNGILGHFFDDEAQKDELIYCYNPRHLQSLTNNARIIRGSGNLVGFEKGYCNPNLKDNYISERSTVLTQVSITPSPIDDSGEAYGRVAIGRDINAGSAEQGSQKSRYDFDVRSTAGIPAYNDVAKCFENSSVNNTTLQACLTKQGVPQKQLFSQVQLEHVSGKIRCIPFGVGTGKYLHTKCTPA
ncbi:putative pilus assembly protein PilX [Moraxella macacae 0408225]|uniref:Putative pilus assembly protein PilX n=1 Tax=Moraxella macacae 0408225 TaxID=1230338 RepID=L2F9N4_9GAMM|nr:hypothetical protein [Moraxella macacae]ELA09784.1 putative pilus assembly protein PilX [Moraxella macacae 0408225]